MKKALLVCAFVLAYVILFAGLAYFVEMFFRYKHLYYTMVDLTVVFTNVFMFSLFMFYRARTRKHG